MDFADFFRYMGQDLGMYDTFLPFLLVFVIMFAMLEKTKVLGQEKDKNGTDGPRTRLNVLLALVMGALVVIPHVLGLYPRNRDIVVIINTALPNMAAVLVAVVMTLVMIGMLWKPNGEDFDGFQHAAVPFAAIAIVIYVFGAAAGWWGAIFPMSDDTVSLILILLVFGLVFWFITKPAGGGDGDGAGAGTGGAGQGGTN